MAWEKAQSMWRSHRAGRQQPVTLCQDGFQHCWNSWCGPFIQKVFFFQSSTGFSGQGHSGGSHSQMTQDLAELLRAHFMCKVTQGQSATPFQVEAPLFSLVCFFFFFPLYNSLSVSISHFLHLCSSFYGRVGKWCLFRSLQLSMAFCFVRSTPCPQQQCMKYVEIALRSWCSD